MILILGEMALKGQGEKITLGTGQYFIFFIFANNNSTPNTTMVKNIIRVQKMWQKPLELLALEVFGQYVFESMYKIVHNSPNRDLFF